HADARIALRTSARTATNAGRCLRTGASAADGVEDEAGSDEERERDHDNDGHAAEILGDIATFPGRRALETRRWCADGAGGPAARSIARRSCDGDRTRWLLSLGCERSRRRRPARRLNGPAGARAYAVVLCHGKTRIPDPVCPA